MDVRRSYGTEPQGVDPGDAYKPRLQTPHREHFSEFENVSAHGEYGKSLLAAVRLTQL